VIFLSPGRIAYPEQHVHYTVTHELGHVVQHVLMPFSRSDLWSRYAELRGLGAFDEDGGDHASRPAEIFAEDFRVLFGGEDARCGGNVENHGLVPPEQVEGLSGFMLSLFDEWQGCMRIMAYPNPFQSDVVFEAFSLEHDRALERVVIFDVLGRRLRVLDVAAFGSALIPWDGKNGRGETVGAGTYFASIRAAGEVHLRKLIKTAP
jgi:hypothetical protein